MVSDFESLVSKWIQCYGCSRNMGFNSLCYCDGGDLDKTNQVFSKKVWSLRRYWFCGNCTLLIARNVGSLGVSLFEMGVYAHASFFFFIKIINQ